MSAIKVEKELTLAELAAVLDSDKKMDYAVPAEKIQMRFAGDDLSKTEMVFERPNDYAAVMPVTGYATDQFHSRLSNGLKGVADHLRANKMPETYSRLMSDILQKNSSVFRVRTLDNTQSEQRHVRAVVSDRYKPIDDDLIFNTAIPLIDSGRFQGIGGNKTEIRTVAKLIEREAAIKIQSGGRTREFHLGFILQNSEVGAGSASFSMFMTDRWCQNGCIFSKEVLANISYKHIGSRIDIRHGLIENTAMQRAEMDSIKTLIEQATMQAMSMKGREKIKAAIEASINREIKRPDLPEFFADLGKEVGLTKKEVEELPLYAQTDEMNQLGMQAAITALAQAKPYERRLELESIGGNVLMMPERRWEALSAA